MNSVLCNLNERLIRNNIETIYSMNEIDEVLKYYSPRNVILKTLNNFNIQDEYFGFDKYGNLESYCNLDELLKLYKDI